MAVFNPGVTFFQGKFYMLYRAIGEYDNYISTVGLAVSDDGINFERQPEPLLSPQNDYEKYGIEDLRINPLEGTFYLTYTVLGSPAKEGGEPHQVGLIKTKDFKSFERVGMITPKRFCSRNGILFPEKIGNDYVLLHRPIYAPIGSGGLTNVAPKIMISYSYDLLHWRDDHLLMERLFWWENFKIGGGTPPIRTEKGWLMIYHGVQQLAPENFVYRGGIVLLDLEDPSKVIYRSEEPILEPVEDYEICGDSPNVVFPTGLVEKEGVLYLYYGAADTTVCLATASLEELLFSLK